jgi:hypothetical protein
MRFFEVVIGVVTAAAACGALFFAWRTVVEARAAATEARFDQASRRLESVVDLVANIRLANRNANQVMSGMYQDRLRPLVLTLSLDLPKTRELAERQFTSNGYPQDEALATEALDELREAAHTLDASFAPGLHPDSA